MIRATAISIVDQALLSAINFLVALLLIRFATQPEYGLYSQLIGLQALFSVIHAGLFVSAFLALLPRQAGLARVAYQAGMARAEIGVTLISAVIVAVSTWFVSNWLGHPIGPGASTGAALALLGLWWREFARVRYFAEGGAWRVLRLDLGYAVLLAVGIGAIVMNHAISAATVLSCMGMAGALIAVLPLLRQARLSSARTKEIGQAVRSSWIHARWEVSTSLVTWAHGQSYVFFAAIQGGLVAAAEISAARLLTSPLALIWISYASILRPEASKLFAAADSHRALRGLALRSALFVVGLALAYALVLSLAMPLFNHFLFGDRFPRVESMAFLWLVYFALTGMTTIATSLLRSAFQFKVLFKLHALCAAVATAAFCAGLAFETPAAFVVGLVAVEALLALLAWRLLNNALGRHTLEVRPAPEAMVR